MIRSSLSPISNVVQKQNWIENFVSRCLESAILRASVIMKVGRVVAMGSDDGAEVFM